MLDRNCPRCGKDDKTEIITVEPDRTYTVKCGYCKKVFVIKASKDSE